MINVVARLLVQRLEKARNSLTVAKEAYAKLIDDFGGKISGSSSIARVLSM